ncbi:synaptojanin-1 [Sabethes cyaneus]|uniref:synaptojanin-1 n=1 Tax=Sabethes cyaneus TaxID=53552 RepID=UPI00237E4813|nr:synaptojanin-1 [Sabethes cyaneus]
MFFMFAFVQFAPSLHTQVAKLVLLVSTFCVVPTLGGLLRTPKVYNAVITTDENLTPSRAYPVVQPVVHEAGLSYPFGAFGPFGLYNAFNAYPGFYQPQPTSTGASAAQVQGRNSFFVGREPEPQLQDTPIETLPGAKPFPEKNLPLREPPVPEIIPDPNNSIAPKAPEGPRPNYEGRPVDSKNPLQLNEFGYPPSLIPVAAYNNNGQLQSPPAFNLQNYPYNFPVLYDSFGNYNPTQYQSILPPFGYFPQLSQPNPYFSQNVPPNAPINNAVDPQQFNRDGREQQLQDPIKPNLPNAPEEIANSDENKPEPPPAAAVAAAAAAEAEAAAAEELDESIKNNANKNRAIPDVPPPPIPSGAKEVEQP